MCCGVGGDTHALMTMLFDRPADEAAVPFLLRLLLAALLLLLLLQQQQQLLL